MKGNITIDNGNTSVKVAYFIGTRMVASNRFMRRDSRLLDRFISSYKPDSAIVCSTAASAVSERIEQVAAQRCRQVTLLTHETPMPITLGYRTPATLGRDRIATAVGAWSIAGRQDSDVLVIEAGTAITYDLITADGCFVGGNIAPGLRLRFKALHEHTGRLPLVSVEGDAPIVGYDTETAIRSGVLLGLVGEVKNYIAELRRTRPALTVFLTGGDAPLLLSHLDDTAIIHNQHLSATGLNHILLYNQAKENE